MAKIQEIIAVIGEYQDSHYDHLSPDEIADMLDCEGFHVAFKENDKILFSAFIELLENEVHVMHVGGKFPSHIEYLKTFCVGLGKAYNKNMIIFDTKKDSVAIIGRKLGFKKIGDCYGFKL